MLTVIVGVISPVTMIVAIVTVDTGVDVNVFGIALNWLRVPVPAGTTVDNLTPVLDILLYGLMLD